MAPLPWFALPLMVGAAWPHVAVLHPVYAWWLVGPLLLVAAWWLDRAHPRAVPALLAAAGWLLGAWLGHTTLPLTTESGPRLFAATGSVTQVAWQNRSQGFSLGTSQGRVFVRAPAAPGVAPGDRVTVRGLWEQDLRGPVVKAGELEVVTRREDGPRGWAWRGLARLDHHRELGLTLILGRGSPPEKPDFKRSGLLHLLAVSGAHLAIAAALGAWLLRHAGVAWLPRQFALGALVVGYAWLTDGSPATIRALAMALALIAYDLSAREPHPLGALALAALVLVGLDPAVARDLGFQLSLAAVLGIVTLGRELEQWRERVLPLKPWPLDRPLWRGLLWSARSLCAGLEIGVAASLATMPILAAWFQTMTPWTPFTTLVAAIPTTLALWLGLPLVTLAGLWPAGPWEALYRSVEWNLGALAGSAAWAASLPGSLLPASLPAWAGLLWILLFIPGHRYWTWFRVVLAPILVLSCLI